MPAGVAAVVLAVGSYTVSAAAAGDARWADPAVDVLSALGAPPATTAAGQLRDYDRAARRWDVRAQAEPTPPGTGWQTIRVGGLTRRYLLVLPPGSPGGARRRPALLLVFHGLGERVSGFATRTGLIGAARTAGVVLVLPESHGPAFDDGRFVTGGPQDTAFALAVVHRLVSARVVDPSRVTVAGFSNGAGMAMRIAGAAPRAVAAVVSIDGEMIDAPGAPRPTGPVRAVLLHGTADRLQPWRGRRRRGLTSPSYVSVLATVAQWVRVDRAGHPSRSVIQPVLAPSPSSPSSPGRGPGTGRSRVTSVVVTSWAPGSGGAGVTLYAMVGMGHRWPLGPGQGPPGAPVDPVSATTLTVTTALTATTGQR